MSDQHHFKFSTGVLAYPLAITLFIWIVFWFEIRFGIILNTYGVYPGTVKGLRGIIFSPFIHIGIEHLYHNTIPLFVLSAALFYFYRKIAWKVLIFGILLSGLFTWFIGRPANHIGASGLIYVLVSFTFFKGVFAKHFRLIALSLIVVFLYGSLVWGIIPLKKGVSWEGHLGGMITGLVFAILFRKEIAKPKKYDWEKEDYNEEDDAFMKHFDENGNFIEHVEDDNPSVEVNYEYKEQD